MNVSATDFDLRACPCCESTRIHFTGAGEAFGVCVDCRTVFVAYPEDWCRDPFDAEPCDDCAFRPGSTEQLDRDRWEEILTVVRDGQQPFLCHKGAPVAVDLVAKRVEYLVDQQPEHRRRWCAGFARAFAVRWNRVADIHNAALVQSDDSEISR